MAKKFKYHARPGSGLTDEGAQIVGKELTRIRSMYGYLTPEVVVKEARSPGTVLHDYFGSKFNVEDAANAYFLIEAQQLINKVHITVTVKEKEITGRAFFSVNVKAKDKTKKDDPWSQYVPVQEVVQKEDQIQNAYQKALWEYDRVRAQYEHIEELKDIHDAINKHKRGGRKSG